ncbi:MAG: iron chelate uptake ABC transporter family permease subunit, partial [Gemmatimonadota bacterium]|nr:iron chelate uptake ABC transporter family permease subunit [Gemmatimonadota bacterium]
LVYARELNVLLLGDEQASQLGVHVERVKLILLTAAACLAAAAVSVSGIIGFVGLLAPHMVRLIVGPDYRILTPMAALAGALLLVLADLVARTAMAPAEMPIGILTTLLGAPFFLYLLHRQRRV